LETRWLHALPREEAVYRLSMDSQDATDANSIQSPVVDQPPDRLRVDAELIRNLANADEPGVSCSRRHGRLERLARSAVARIREGSGTISSPQRGARLAPNGSS
jgi:hypothetical protein